MHDPRNIRKEPIFDDMPIGFGMELVKNPAAMNRFTQLSEEEKRSLVDGAFNVTSREEMRAYVEHFTDGNPFNKSF
ncbi:MAG: hypothetical protein IJX93_00395 [Clostridia bacterium]|nr:hypothetical protein [Clostridia bacterium]MBQ8332216.1 hypothetical protein [Clostridia bacterium]MBQ8370038.1 hypothetical protein [Clostridia bacterium]MBQ8512537.1 hypothetical protein [Clostridia bacterium]